MYKIQANPSGTRSIEVSQEHLNTIERYALFRNLIDSNGIIDENVLEKLKYNVRSLLESETGNKTLLDNNDMKAFGLHQLVLLYIEWRENGDEDEQEDE